MTSTLESSRICVARAIHHVGDLETKISAFMDTDPYQPTVEKYFETDEYIHKIKLVKPMPPMLSCIAFDAISNLRSALDQAGFFFAKAANPSTRGKYTHFPFGDTAADANGAHAGMSREIPKRIFDVMIRFQPYKGGNDLLWAMNKLCNTNKHRILVPMAVATKGVSGRISIDARNSVVMINTREWRWDHSKNEMILGRGREGADFQYDLKFSYLVSFADIDVVIDKPATDILHTLVDITGNILTALEAEGRTLEYLTN